jgi:beta-glucosidase/6-phospho-beta-glucosidase/beta-galactosidase
MNEIVRDLMQSPADPCASFPHLGAFESTRLIGSDTDILGTTRHLERWESDLELLRSAGLRDLRYSVPWHRIEKEPGNYDFTWFDGPMAYMQSHGMEPILDPLHHVSFPQWLHQGFANPLFPAAYERFILRLAQRYPWANRYTVFNEPLPTTIFCSLNGLWYPHYASDDCFVRMAMNTATAICRASKILRQINPQVQFVHVETAETHRPLDKRSEKWSHFANCRRFLMHDLILGSITPAHELYPYLTDHGFTREEMYWFIDNRTSIDVLGLDYYVHSEMEWCWDKVRRCASIRGPVNDPVGFASIGKDYADRFRLPVLLSETNLRGSYQDRLTWLKFMEEQCEALASQVDFRGFCWYPSIDSTDWCHLCTKATGTVDPQGIWGLDEDRWNRHASELSEYYIRLARGLIRSADIPAYGFSPDTAKGLSGFEKLMSHWPGRRVQGEHNQELPSHEAPHNLPKFRRQNRLFAATAE